MKHCPECGRTFSAADDFCSEDGAVLIDAGATAAMPEHQAAVTSEIRCPACGGRAEPGEANCAFCGTKLPEAIAPAQHTEPPTQEGEDRKEDYNEDYQPFSDVKP